MSTAPDPLSPRDPLPLAARVSIGRGAAALVGGLTLVTGALALFDRSGEIPMAALVGAALLVVAGSVAIVVVPWDRHLPDWGCEVVLTSLSAVPITVVLLLYLTDHPTDLDTLVYLAPLATLSALTIPLRRHVVLSVLTLAAGIVATAARGALGEAVFALTAAGAGATLGGLIQAVIGNAFGTAFAREHDAAAANRALMAVVDAARTATSREGRDVLEAVAQATQRLQSDLAAVYLVGSDGNLRYGATFNVPEHLVDQAFPADSGIAGAALTGDRTIVTDDYQQHPRSMSAYRDIGLRAAMATPIRVDSEPIGVLVAGRHEPGGYEEPAVSALELLADHAGRALALTRAIDEDRRLLERLQSLHALQEDFVATVSHELRTPLTVIDGLAETLENRSAALGQDQVERLLSRLRANTTGLSTIVTSLLEAARLDRGLVEVEEEVVDLWRLVEGCVARLAPILHNHKLDLDLDDALVLADGALLERVVDNLLTNAERHTPPGTTVRIEARTTADTCRVTVSDDGPGIEPADLATITERFTRGGDLHTRPTRGLGLGLALADQVLRLHGTRLEVESPPEGGARFQFHLRLAG